MLITVSEPSCRSVHAQVRNPCSRRHKFESCVSLLDWPNSRARASVVLLTLHGARLTRDWGSCGRCRLQLRLACQWSYRLRRHRSKKRIHIYPLSCATRQALDRVSVLEYKPDFNKKLSLA